MRRRVSRRATKSTFQSISGSSTATASTLASAALSSHSAGTAPMKAMSENQRKLRQL